MSQHVRGTLHFVLCYLISDIKRYDFQFIFFYAYWSSEASAADLYSRCRVRQEISRQRLVLKLISNKLSDKQNRAVVITKF